MKQYSLLCFVGVIAIICAGIVQSEDSSTTTTVVTSTTPAPNASVVCKGLHNSCEDCLKHASCLWCKSSPVGEQCMAYPAGDIFPHKDVCSLSDARWGVCWLNYLALLISMAVLAGILLISCCCCVYCCCCRTNKKKQRRRYEQEDARMEHEREERRQRSEARRAERQTKYDEIRRKYGLIKDDTPYQKFDNEA